jgi:ribosomal-protein-alanine N-acetyltransferase
MVYGLILAGGTGSRMGGELPKQFLPLMGKPVLLHTLKAFEDCPLVDGYYLVCHPDYFTATESLICRESHPKLRRMVPGGETRQVSCHRGLAAMMEACDPQDVVLVHDAARPLVTGETLIRCTRTVEAWGAANAVYPSENTMLLSRDGAYADEQPPRTSCYTVQTPQGFHLGELYQAHEAYRAQSSPLEVTDDCGLYAAITGKRPRLCLGDKDNLKITTPLDLVLGEAILRHRAETCFLETPRMRLCRLTMDDVEAVKPILCDEQTMYAWEHGFSHAEVVEFVEKNLLRYGEHGYAYLKAVEKSTGEIIGLMGPLVETIHGEDHVGLAYILRRDRWGMGYASEGARASLNYAFTTLGADRVITEIRPENGASRRVAEALGMQVVDSFVKHYQGKDMVHFIYAISRKDWQEAGEEHGKISKHP